MAETVKSFTQRSQEPETKVFLCKVVEARAVRWFSPRSCLRLLSQLASVPLWNIHSWFTFVQQIPASCFVKPTFTPYEIVIALPSLPPCVRFLFSWFLVVFNPNPLQHLNKTKKSLLNSQLEPECFSHFKIYSSSPSFYLCKIWVFVPDSCPTLKCSYVTFQSCRNSTVCMFTILS